jgi:hypothetical protein
LAAARYAPGDPDVDSQFYVAYNEHYSSLCIISQSLLLGGMGRRRGRRTRGGSPRGGTKLALIRKAAGYNFPAEPDIDTLLAEMEAGRLAEIEAGLPGPDYV